MKGEAVDPTVGDPAGTVALLGSVLAGSFVSSLVPLVNAEVLAVGAAVLAPRRLGFAVALTVAIGQMVGKTLLYGAGTAGRRRSSERVARLIARIEERRNATHLTFFASAVLGLPPFYLMTLAAGAVGIRLPQFLVLGLLGRLLRFYLLVQVPHVAEWFT